MCGMNGPSILHAAVRFVRGIREPISPFVRYQGNVGSQAEYDP